MGVVDRNLKCKIKNEVTVKHAKRENTQSKQLLLSPNRGQRWNRGKNPTQTLRIFAQTAFTHSIFLQIKVANATSFKLISIEYPPHPPMPQIKSRKVLKPSIRHNTDPNHLEVSLNHPAIQITSWWHLRPLSLFSCRYQPHQHHVPSPRHATNAATWLNHR